MPETLAIARSAAPLRHQVLQTLRNAIIDGQLSPGQRLTERELTEMLGVSRTVVRESLRQLESEGLIELIPNKGPVVRNLSAAEARDLYRIREMLEGLSARLFAENASAEQLAALEETLGHVVAAYEAGDPKRILETKNEFYAAMHAGAGSETLSTMLTSVLTRIWRWRAIGLTHPNRSANRSAESVSNLRALLAALKLGDGDRAESWARLESRLAAQELMQLLESGEDFPGLNADK